jgi:hypothetical protein
MPSYEVSSRSVGLVVSGSLCQIPYRDHSPVASAGLSLVPGEVTIRTSVLVGTLRSIAAHSPQKHLRCMRKMGGAEL